MKKVTLNFREVAVDGLPEKSMNVVVLDVSKFDGSLNPYALRFSKKYEAFNVGDDSENANTAFHNVAYWMPLDEFIAAMKKARRVKQRA